MDDISDSEFDLIYNDPDDFDTLLQPQQSKENAKISPNNYQNKQNKRSFEDIFEPYNETRMIYDDRFQDEKRAKLEAEANRLEMVQQILEARRQYQESYQFSLNCNNSNCTTDNFRRNKFKESVSLSVPKWPFIQVTSITGDLMFVRFHSQAFLDEEINNVKDKFDYSYFSKDSESLWNAAYSILKQPSIKNTDKTASYDTQDLWTSIYKPKLYVELLTDETINRSLLKWLKLWDHVVFEKPIIPQKQPPEQPQSSSSWEKQKNIVLKLDATNRPEFKIALLYGPPGIGKTSMAHLIATKAGYKVIELNASDDRTVDAFRTVLENSTQMQSISCFNPKPNCIILDEIDGAPQATVEYLVKFVTGQKSKKKGNLLKRPIICICNDVYSPALRSLRQVAYQINFNEMPKNRIKERLNTICRKEGIKTDLHTLSVLTEKTNNDIRSCLTFLYFFKNKTDQKPLKPSDILESEIGLKDFKSDLFTIWRKIFYWDRQSHKTFKERANEIRKSLEHVNEFNKLATGVFENYLKFTANKNIASVNNIEAIEGFSYNDFLITHIDTYQNYQIYPYLYRSFVLWHFIFGDFDHRQSIMYPTYSNEVFKRMQSVHLNIGDFLTKNIPIQLRSSINRNNLITDLLPYLNKLIKPKNLRDINLNFYRNEEKQELDRILKTMKAFDLNYIQEKINESYFFKLEPSIDEIVTFTDFPKPTERPVTHATKQVIARELELMKVKIESNLVEENRQKVVPKSKTVLKNNSDKVPANIFTKTETPLKKKSAGASIRDFFDKTGCNRKKTANKVARKRPIGIWFQFTEGYSNAVRTDILLKDLL